MKKLTKHLLIGLAAGAIALPALAQEMPGEGKTVRFARSDSLGASYVQTEILTKMMEDLGYDVDLTTIGMSAFFQAAAQGDLDMTGDINVPQRKPQYDTVADRLALLGNGMIQGGGTNGYVIDKATAEKYDITDVGQLKDPELAKVFDSDGDGTANLANCDPGWSCGDVVEHQLKDFGLSDTVESIRAKYEPLMGEVFARYAQGEPVFYYTWAPSFVTEKLKPGEDVVWLPIPFDSLPEGVTSESGHEVAGVIGCAGGQDPCRMATGSWNWKIAANREFIADNPAIVKLSESVSWPLDQWSTWEVQMGESNTDRAIKAIAAEWIESNQDQYNAWVEAAREAAS
jgi:glycine betaine/proline transport system substrate-binding protein|tara:strand:+ start:11362 stop:12390 length:1029 start_codon:yes stop_codon:yes gene_type:complete